MTWLSPPSEQVLIFWNAGLELAVERDDRTGIYTASARRTDGTAFGTPQSGRSEREAIDRLRETLGLRA